MRLIILCSGSLGDTLLRELRNNNEIVAVFTDSHSSAIIGYCQENSIPLFIGNPRNGKGRLFIDGYEVDVIISINYLFLIEKDIYSYSSKLAFNIHGSLLPKYRGRTPHVWAIINNETETGVTAHKIDDGCDSGDIILQKKIYIQRSDTGHDILIRFHDLYKEVVFEVLNRVKNQTLSFLPQNNSQATYFGKRTPDSGRIDWGWQKERIYNWIRAQAFPYPGAFTFFKNQKITIDKIEFDDSGFSEIMPNGLIVKVNPLLIKTPNGLILISEWRENLILIEGEILK